MQTTGLRMQEQFYYENHLAKSTDMSNELDGSGLFLGYIVESQKKKNKRGNTPFLGSRRPTGDQHYGEVVADSRNFLQPAKHLSNLSNNQNKRSTLSKEFDVST